jgi:hypothetical protein
VDEAEGSDLSNTDWVFVSRTGARLESREITEVGEEIEEIPGMRVWTDDFNNLFQILK